MSYEQILSERRDDVLVLTLNRPERLNAIVVTGAGRGFCAGADIGGQFASNLDERAAEPPPKSKPASAKQSGGERSAGGWVQLCRSSKPLIAAINGPAIGVGLTMILPFDQLVAADGAKLSARFVKMGLVPELASSHYLVARCGWGNASWLALSGATVLADEALRLGLVDRVVPAERVLDEALTVASELAGNPGPQVRMIKDLLSRNASETDIDAVQARELEALERAYRTPEHREAVSAFLEKRPPKFR
jgi:enoyl-CoA hydratase/carnithine racemase